MERGNEQGKKAAKDEVPGDRIKDAPALARELRWRVRLANGYSSDDDVRSRRKPSNGVSNGSTSSSSTKKRKRSEEDADVEERGQTFLHFKPRRWDGIVTHPAEKEARTIRGKKPVASEAGWADAWTAAVDADMEGGDGENAMVERRREVVVKVRRTAKGLERQRVERVLEEWVWDPIAVKASAASETNGSTATNGSSDLSPAAEANGAEDVKTETNGD